MEAVGRPLGFSAGDAPALRSVAFDAARFFALPVFEGVLGASPLARLRLGGAIVTAHRAIGSCSHGHLAAGLHLRPVFGEGEGVYTALELGSAPQWGRPVARSESLP